MPSTIFSSIWRWLLQALQPAPSRPASSGKTSSTAKAAGGLSIGGVLVAGLFAWQLDYTSGWEGVRFTPYRDVAGVLTVCMGHTGPDIVAGKTYSQAECAALFQADLAKVDQALAACVKPPAALAPEVVVALRDFAFNVGTGAACSSTLVRKINAGDTAGACDEFHRWTKAGGRTIYGLKVRRELGVPDRLSEADLCRTGL